MEILCYGVSKLTEKEKQLIEMIDFVYVRLRDQYAREYIRKKMREFGIWYDPMSARKERLEKEKKEKDALDT